MSKCCRSLLSVSTRSVTDEGDLIAAKARLIADRGAGAPLALQTVAHGDADWIALNRKMKLPATTGGVACCHGSIPWMSILAL